ncbi:MAG: hypothetical protein M1170_00545 [Patescibacteria group bacterium]|nr:hypothetical protein [Patescibacteria group bacterium]
MELNSQNIEHKALEADIERLSKEIAEKRNLLEHKDLSDRELVKQTLHPIIKQTAVQPQAAASQPSSAQSSVLPDYLQDSSTDVKLQVEELIDLTLHQGIEKAVKAAGKTNAFVLDAFHDALTDKLHGILKQKGIL